ncbi:MAG: hypothetical protein QXT45_07980 [Candidatus Bilamarchaeaceae archaeon]
MIVERIYDAISSNIAKKAPKLGAWNIGGCVLANWAADKGIEPSDEVSPREQMVLDLGIKIEDVLAAYLQAVCSFATIRPVDRFFKIDKLNIIARPDFILTLPSSQDLKSIAPFASRFAVLEGRTDRLAQAGLLSPPYAGEQVVLELKSMNSFSFRDAIIGKISDRYWHQCQAYLEALNFSWCILLAYRKDDSSLFEVWVGRDKGWLSEAEQIVEKIRAKERPPRPYSLVPYGDDLVLQYPCSYCNYRTWCWGKLKPIAAGDRTYLAPLSINE